MRFYYWKNQCDEFPASRGVVSSIGADSTLSGTSRGQVAFLLLILSALLSLGAKAGAEPVQPEPTLRLISIYGGSAALDLVSTEYALARGGVHEGNPLLRQCGVRVGVMAGTVALEVWGTQKLQRDGHPGWARALKVGIIAKSVLVCVLNMRAAQRAR